MASLVWTPIEVTADWTGPAVYEIRLVLNAKPARISRLLGVDSRGILCIGATGNMERRRKGVVSGVTTCSGHSECNLFWYLKHRTQLDAVFPGYALEYSFINKASEHEAVHAEERLIKAYFCDFGEPPPLNSAIPGRYEEPGWLDAMGLDRPTH